MPVTPTYPGIYIEEILSTAHTITPAPTSVTVFVGYTHPFKTKPAHWNHAVEIFSFSDYEREFGGLFSVDWLADDVGQAVSQFFLNGGSVAWVLALQASLHDVVSGTTTPLAAPSLTVAGTGGSIVFTGLEPGDAVHAITVSITNLQATTSGGATDIADIVVAYGNRSETYRHVSLNASDSANGVEKRIGTASAQVSSLVTVAPPPAGSYPTAWTGTMGATALGVAAPPGGPFTSYFAGDFTPAFQADGSLDKTAFNLLLTPGVWDPAVVSEALSFCEHKRAFMIVDPPADAVADSSGAPRPMIGDIMTDQVPNWSIPKSENGALYFPYLRTNDPRTGAVISVPPSGVVAGIFAKEDNNRGVWKAPAGYETVIPTALGVVDTGRMTDARQGDLNPKGVNCLRGFPGIGTVVFGARTLVTANPAFEQYRYVPVRRMALFLEQSLVNNLGWVIHEPNDNPLWVSIRTSIDNFMLGLFHQGAFQGKTPSQAFQVVCDETTTTPDDQANGIVNIVVAFAPLKPAEFVVIKLAQLAGQATS